MQDKPVALVTGANQGIGLQIAKEMAQHGYTVLVGSRNLDNGERAARSIGADAHALQLDVTDAASIAAATERIRREFGRLNVLVNNAAISHAGKPGRSLEEMLESNRASVASLDEMRKVWETNVSDMLANLMHLCSLEGVDFGEALVQAKEFFDEELEEELGDGWQFMAADPARSH